LNNGPVSQSGSFDGREGLRSLDVLIAAYLSARDGPQGCVAVGVLAKGTSRE